VRREHVRVDLPRRRAPLRLLGVLRQHGDVHAHPHPPLRVIAHA
jgi:hypothetical protein